MICVGPRFVHNSRIKDFCGYFKPESYFSNIEAAHYGYTYHTGHSFSCETKCFMHLRTSSIDESYTEKAAETRLTNDYDYSIECFRTLNNDSLISFFYKLRTECSNAYSIFFRPSIVIDTPDVLLADVYHGFLLINVCEDLENIKTKYVQLFNIKQHIYNIYLSTIKIDSILHRYIYGYVRLGLYFPNSPKEAVEKKLTELDEQKDRKDPYRHLIRLFPDDDFSEKINNIHVNNIKESYYSELVATIIGNFHSYKQGNQNINLSQTQIGLIKSTSKFLRVKGVAGCGKTQVIAHRAVERHIKTGNRVLILVYNATLIQYLKIRIKQVSADFNTSAFIISTYHQFFASMYNAFCSHEDENKPYIKNTDQDNSEYEEDIPEDDFEQFNKNIDDEDFFKPYEDSTPRYKTIIIDEIQDFKTAWVASLVKYFLAEDGTISVFGDGEQNVYSRAMDQQTRMPLLKGFVGRWNEMTERISLRIINPEVARLSYLFGHTFMNDSMDPISTMNEIALEQYFIKYWNVGNVNARTLSCNIVWIIQNFRLSVKDTVVLASSVKVLRDIEKWYTNNYYFCMRTFENAKNYADLCETRDKNLNSLKKPEKPKDSEEYKKYIRERNRILKKFSNDLNGIRKAAKYHFTTDCEQLKISTIQSFKGWEANNIILILQPELPENTDYKGYYIQKRETSPALIYTALTRTRCNLFILNLGNTIYHDFFQSNIN